MRGGEHEAASRFEVESVQPFEITRIENVSFFVEPGWATNKTSLPAYREEDQGFGIPKCFRAGRHLTFNHNRVVGCYHRVAGIPGESQTPV